MTGTSLSKAGALAPLSIARREVLADQVYESLSGLIVSGQIPPDSRINIEAVARTIGVSPTPVREALSRLEADELVEKEALKGYRTTPLLSKSEVIELYELRMLLEPSSARRASAKLDASSGRRLRAEIEGGRDAAAAGDGVRLYRHDENFHKLIIELAGNQAVRRAYDRTHAHLHMFRLSFGKAMVNTVAEHDAIVDALVNGNASDAESAMMAHLQTSLKRFL